MRPTVMLAALTEKPLNVRPPFDIATELEALTKATSRTKKFLDGRSFEGISASASVARAGH